MFAYVKKYGEDRFTWQPTDKVRIAAVVSGINDGQKGFVLAGRNMREVEIREDQLTKMTFLAWLLGLGTTLVLVALKKLLLPKR